MKKEDFIQNRYGYCYYHVYRNKNKALIYGLYIHKRHRGKGKAKLLLQHVINEIKSLYDIEVINIFVQGKKGLDTEKISNFYKRMGLSVKNG